MCDCHHYCYCSLQRTCYYCYYYCVCYLENEKRCGCYYYCFCSLQNYNQKPAPTQNIKNSKPSRYTDYSTISSINHSLYLNSRIFSNDSYIPTSRSFINACLKAFEAFRIPDPVKMLHLCDVFKENLEIWGESTGLPWKNRGYATKGDIKNNSKAINRIRTFYHIIKAGDWVTKQECLQYEKTVVTNNGKLLRQTVWEYPATISFGELVFVEPLTEAYLNMHHGPIAYDCDQKTFDGIKKPANFSLYETYYKINFQSFHESVPEWLIDEGFEILEFNINFRKYKNYGTTNSYRMKRMFRYLKRYFIETNIRTSTGLKIKKNAGIIPDSYFSKIISSICNYILCQWVCYHFTGKPAKEIIVLGQSALFTSYTRLNFIAVEKLLSSIKMKADLDLVFFD